MKKKWIGLGIGSGLLFSLFFLGSCNFFHSESSDPIKIKVYAETLRGLNHDMREILRIIQTGSEEDDDIQILHDQLHLMKEILHLVKRGNEEDSHFRQLHDLNHDMRENWHQLKNGDDKAQYLQALENQLHEMKEFLHTIRGEGGNPSSAARQDAPRNSGVISPGVWQTVGVHGT